MMGPSARHGHGVTRIVARANLFGRRFKFDGSPSGPDDINDTPFQRAAFGFPVTGRQTLKRKVTLLPKRAVAREYRGLPYVQGHSQAKGFLAASMWQWALSSSRLLARISKAAYVLGGEPVSASSAHVTAAQGEEML
jgi:hypothetical protein